MIGLVDVNHGTYESIEALNPRFVPGSLKMRVTVDTEHEPRASDEQVLMRLVAAFPGLLRHECRSDGNGKSWSAGETPIRLLRAEPSANQAHVLEHVVIEVLGVFDPRRVRSGVTCAWKDPPYRNDVFIENDRPALGEAVARLAVSALDAALDDRPMLPLYQDLMTLSALLRRGDRWSESLLSQRSRLPGERVREALAVLSGSDVVATERPTLNLSAEPWYRMS